MKRSALVFALLTTALVGCRAQVPPASGYKVNLSWQAAVPATGSTWLGCTTANPCVYGAYRCIGSTSSCSNTSSTAWVEITTPSTRTSSLTFVDSTVTSGVQANYTVVTFQGSSSSGASNIALFNIPGVPAPPVLNTPSLATAVKPAFPQGVPQPSMYARIAAPVLNTINTGQ